MKEALRKARKGLLIAVLLIFIAPIAIAAVLSMLGGLLILILLGFATFFIVKALRVDTDSGGGEDNKGGQARALRQSKLAQRLAKWLQEGSHES